MSKKILVKLAIKYFLNEIRKELIDKLILFHNQSITRTVGSDPRNHPTNSKLKNQIAHF